VQPEQPINIGTPPIPGETVPPINVGTPPDVPTISQPTGITPISLPGNPDFVPTPGDGTAIAPGTEIPFGDVDPDQIIRQVDPGTGQVTDTGTVGGGFTGPTDLGGTDFLPGADLSRITPEETLITQRISPSASERLLGIQEQVGGAAGDVAGFGGFNLSPEALQARQAVLQTLEEARGAPDRGALAQEQFDILQERGRPGFERRLRDIGRSASALGRVGAGITTTNLADLGAERERELALAGRELAAEAAGLSQQDRLRLLGATTGAAGFLGGQDIELGQRGFEAQRAQLRDLAGLESQIFGQEAIGREELRGERGFELGLERQGRQDIIDQIRLEEELFQGDFDRRLAEALALGQLGAF
jgi:hypothetical protein